MKKAIYLFISLLIFISCEKNENLRKTCKYEEIPFDINIQSNSIIPLNSQNFWVYSDSLWEDGIFQNERSTLLKIDKAYELDGLKSLEFSSIIPQLTLRNDTLFSTIFTPEETSLNCYELLYPMFFSTEDTIQVNNAQSDKFVYRSSDAIETIIGTYSNNIIYKEEDIFEVIINEQIGIIKIYFFIFNANNQKIKRRTLTLKDFDLK
jgi:hypothetical protein